VGGNGERTPVPHERCLLLAGREHDRAALRVHQPTGVFDRVREFERRVADDLSECVTEAAGWRGVSQLEHKPGGRRAASASADPTPRDADDNSDECDSLGEQQTSLDVAVPYLAVPDRGRVRYGHEAEIDGARDEHEPT